MLEAQNKNANTIPSAIIRCEALDRAPTLMSSVCILAPRFTIAQRYARINHACPRRQGCDTVELTTMPDAALPITALARLDVRSALDILIIATLIYYLLKLLRGTRAVQMLVAVGLLMIFYRGARWARLEMVEWLLTAMLPYTAST